MAEFLTEGAEIGDVTLFRQVRMNEDQDIITLDSDDEADMADLVVGPTGSRDFCPMSAMWGHLQGRRGPYHARITALYNQRAGRCIKKERIQY